MDFGKVKMVLPNTRHASVLGDKKGDKKHRTERNERCLVWPWGQLRVYETWCRNADLIFQNASTAPGAGHVSGQGRKGRARRPEIPGPGRGRDSSSHVQLPTTSGGRVGDRKGPLMLMAGGRKCQNLLIDRSLKMVIVISQVLSHSNPSVSLCHASKDRRPIGIGPKEHPIGHAVR